MLPLLKATVKKLPGFRGLIAQRETLIKHLEQVSRERDLLATEVALLNQEKRVKNSKTRDMLKQAGFVPPGHFYSPIPNFEDIKRDECRIFGEVPVTVPGIDLNPADQMELLTRFIPYYQQMSFTPERQEGYRYYYENPAFSYSDAIVLHCLMRHVQPRRIIEVGSGFSSCMVLDTNERFFDNEIETTFIEPYPELLQSLLKEEDKSRVRILPTRLQDVDIAEFEVLEENDVLFVDSTHVSKIDSDVNRILFEILPRLNPGVYIHFHDIFYPFEYPAEWVLEGRAWNEIYILRAFLQFNRNFRPVLMNTYMEYFHPEFFEENLPLCMQNTGGSIWLRRE